MKIDKRIVQHIAHLSRIEIKDNEMNDIQNDLERITDFMEILNEIDTEGVEPLIFMTNEINVLREDDAITSISHEEALKNAPYKDTDYFRIPKVKN